MNTKGQDVTKAALMSVPNEFECLNCKHYRSHRVC